MILNEGIILMNFITSECVLNTLHYSLGLFDKASAEVTYFIYIGPSSNVFFLTFS